MNNFNKLQVTKEILSQKVDFDEARVKFLTLLSTYNSVSI